VVTWGGEYVSYVPIFKIASKILLGRMVCLSLSRLSDEASLCM
jgi:hypothetical protein